VDKRKGYALLLINASFRNNERWIQVCYGFTGEYISYRIEISDFIGKKTQKSMIATELPTFDINYTLINVITSSDY
jgi:hypothetical protein